jgi:DNA polymerase-3 subunit alpha
MQPSSFEDCIALTSVARPGPLGAGLDKVYSNRKHGIDTNTEFILGKFPYMESTYNTTLYQEQPMLLAKDIAGFSDNQADSYLRKAMAKKKRDLLELCKNWFIYGKPQEDEYGPAIKGGIANGYKEEDLKEYFDSLDSYCSYLFNKSHATSYSLNSMITAWLKHYYPVEFYASVLSIQDNKERCINYMQVIEEQFGITTVHPDINKSGIFFTPNPENNTILFGLNSIKGVGGAALEELVAKQPYKDMADLLERTEKRVINKKVMTALIKAGCFDCWNENRYEVMNQYYELRKVKDVELYDIDTYNKQSIIDFEMESLEIALTARYWFDEVANGEKVTFDCEIVKVTEKFDRNNNLMAFVNVKSVDDNYPIELVVFSSTYSRTVNFFDMIDHKYITVSGKKDGKKIIVNKVREAR